MICTAYDLRSDVEVVQTHDGIWKAVLCQIEVMSAHITAEKLHFDAFTIGIGIEINLEGRASSEISTQRYGGSETRDYELMITGWGSDYPDPVGVILPMFVSDYTVAGGSNWVEYKSEDFDKYLALQGEELDPVKRAKDLQNALDVFADDVHG